MPAKKQKKTSQINLLPQEGLVATTGGRVLLWLLSTFRFIVIVTELFVVGAFIARFWLDAKNTDLSEEIQEDKEIVESYKDFEEEFRDVQERLTIYNTFTKDRGKAVEAINSVIASKPPEVTFSEITTSESNLTLSATSTSEIGIQQFLVNLRSNEKIEKVVLGDIATSEENSVFTFDVTVAYKKS